MRVLRIGRLGEGEVAGRAARRGRRRSRTGRSCPGASPASRRGRAGPADTWRAAPGARCARRSAAGRTPRAAESAGRAGAPRRGRAGRPPARARGRGARSRLREARAWRPCIGRCGREQNRACQQHRRRAAARVARSGFALRGRAMSATFGYRDVEPAREARPGARRLRPRRPPLRPDERPDEPGRAPAVEGRGRRPAQPAARRADRRLRRRHRRPGPALRRRWRGAAQAPARRRRRRGSWSSTTTPRWSRPAWRAAASRRSPGRSATPRRCRCRTPAPTPTSIGFGLRNVTDIPGALAEARRVLKPGGRFLCLEFSQADRGGAAAALRRLFLQGDPAGRRAGGRRRARPTSYLVESIRRFPDQQALAELMARGRASRACRLDQLHRRRRGPAPGLGDLAAACAASRPTGGWSARRWVLIRADALIPRELDPLLPPGARTLARFLRLFAGRDGARGRPGERLARRWSGWGRWRSSSASSSRPAPTSSAPTSPRTCRA